MTSEQDFTERPEDTVQRFARQIQTLEAELVETRRARDLAYAHDTQPYPTAWAYEQACRVIRERDAELGQLRLAAGMTATPPKVLLPGDEIPVGTRACYYSGDLYSNLNCDEPTTSPFPLVQISVPTKEQFRKLVQAEVDRRGEGTGEDDE